MEKRYTLSEGYKSLERIKLMMGYDISKTLNENKLLIFEAESSESSGLTLRMPDKNSYLKRGTELKWNVINNNPETPIVIQSVEVIPPEGGSKDWNCANYPKCTEKRVFVTSFTKNKIPNGYMGTVNTYVNFGFDDYYEKSPGAQKNFNFNLKITTSAGQIQTDFRKGTYTVETELQKKVREIQKKVGERKTPNLGISVPEGFSPFSYEEFIGELDKISQRCNRLKEYYRNLSKIKEGGKPISPKDFLSSTGAQFDRDTISFCKKEYEKIYNKYYDSKFPKGVTPEDKEEFNTQYYAAKTELDNFKRKNMSTRNREPFDQYFDASRLSPELQKKYKELVSKVKGIKSEYGYDDRNLFDKWWEEYGLWVQVGVGVITMIASFGASSPGSIALIASAIGTEATVVRAALLTAERISILADFYMNASVGTYQLAKGDTKEAILSFFFAVLPKVHGMYDKIGKVFGKPSVETTKSLANKISQISLKTKDDVNAFIATLPPEEAKLFRSAMKLSNDDYEKVFKLIQKDMEKTLKVSKGTQVAKGVGKFIGTAALDFTLIHSAQEIYVKSVDLINKYCNNCFTSEEEKQKAKTYLRTLTPDQEKKLKKLLNIIQEQETDNTIKGEKMKVVVTGEFHNELEKWNESLNNEEILKKMDEVLAQMERQKKDTR